MSGSEEVPVNVAAEIATLRGELRVSVADLAGRIDAQAAHVAGRFSEGQQVMLGLDTNFRRLEAVIRDSMEQAEAAALRAEEKCESCHGGFNRRLTVLETWRWKELGGLTVLLLVLDIAVNIALRVVW
jgi:hypothetical protein